LVSNKCKYLIHLLITLSVSPSIAQISSSDYQISLKMGTIRTYQFETNNDDNRLYTLYPELEIQSVLFIKPLYWKLYIGYWDDHVDKPLEIADHITYSTKSKIIGIRAEIQPSYFESNPWINVSCFVGLSQHYLNNKYIGGEDYAGNPGTN